MTLLYSHNDDKYRKKENNIQYDLKNFKMEDLELSPESDLMKRIKKIFDI